MKYEKLRLKWSNITKIAGKQLLDINLVLKSDFTVSYKLFFILCYSVYNEH